MARDDGVFLAEAATARTAVTVSSPRREPSGARARLAVVIVNYRQWDATADLVGELVASPAVRRGDAEIVVVDNHSPPHPAAPRLRRMPHVALRRWKRNRGFARAVNEGVRLSGGDWVLLLNPDLSLSEGFLDGVLERAEQLAREQPCVGIVGFHLRNADGSHQLSVGPAPTFASTLARLLLPRARRKYQAARTDEPTSVPWVTGCCLLAKRACLEQLGGLDERFFLYYEDVDLCLRARERGWEVQHDPSLAVVHHHPLHARPYPAALRVVTRHSLLTYAAAHWSAFQTRWLARLIRVEAALRRFRACRRGDLREAGHYAELSALAHEFQVGDATAARTRLDRLVSRLDPRVGV